MQTPYLSTLVGESAAMLVFLSFLFNVLSLFAVCAVYLPQTSMCNYVYMTLHA